MDLKVYTKEEVKQPSGTEYVYVPNVIDIIPDIIEVATQSDIRNNIWSLERLKQIADVQFVDNKLIINSDKVRYENGNLYVNVTESQMISVELAEDRDELEQQCSLATIWQRGLDPLAEEEGIRWSEVLLGEINVVQLMNDITDALAEVSNSIAVVFSTVRGKDGQEYLTYKIQSVG